MKKIASVLLAALVVLLASVAITSCAKVDLTQTLDGTTWTATEQDLDADVVYSYALTFKNSRFDLVTKTAAWTVTENGRYLYEDPAVTLITALETRTGIRDGNTIKLQSGVVFTKK